MRENRTSGSEGGEALCQLPLFAGLQVPIRLSVGGPSVVRTGSPHGSGTRAVPA